MGSTLKLEDGGDFRHLHWKNFGGNIVSNLVEMRDDRDFFDVTLSCDDNNFVQGHKVILAASSNYMKAVLKRSTPSQHPILIMPPGIRFVDLVNLVDFIYTGEIKIPNEDFRSFMNLAKHFKITGLQRGKDKPLPKPEHLLPKQQQVDTLQQRQNQSPQLPQKPPPLPEKLLHQQPDQTQQQKQQEQQQQQQQQKQKQQEQKQHQEQKQQQQQKHKQQEQQQQKQHQQQQQQQQHEAESFALKPQQPPQTEKHHSIPSTPYLPKQQEQSLLRKQPQKIILPRITPSHPSISNHPYISLSKTSPFQQSKPSTTPVQLLMPTSTPVHLLIPTAIPVQLSKPSTIPVQLQLSKPIATPVPTLKRKIEIHNLAPQMTISPSGNAQNVILSPESYQPQTKYRQIAPIVHPKVLPKGGTVVGKLPPQMTLTLSSPKGLGRSEAPQKQDQLVFKVVQTSKTLSEAAKKSSSEGVGGVQQGPIIIKVEPELIEEMEVDVSSIKIETTEFEDSGDIFEGDLDVDEDDEDDEQSLENPGPFQDEGSSSYLGVNEELDSEEGRVFCDICYKSFTSSRYRLQHFKKVHSDEYARRQLR